VLLKIAYVLTHRIIGMVILLCRDDRAMIAELLVLRHENAVLRRQSGPVRTSRPTGCGTRRWHS
jgi:putative transposase